MIALPGHAAARVARRLSGDPLHAAEAGQGRIAVPDATAVAEELVAAATRYQAAVGLGPAVSLAEAALSWRWAELAARSAAAGVVVEAEARLPELLLAGSPDIVAALRERSLAPLCDETDASRARLESTLRAWLRHRGAQAQVASELGVHPQTVRYRMGRLRELFGGALDDPETRFALELALRAP
jgi:DNA-binding PucR family transcriptional regulator